MAQEAGNWSEWALSAPELPTGTAQLDKWYGEAQAWLNAAPFPVEPGSNSALLTISTLHAYWRNLNEVQQSSVDALGLTLGGSITTIVGAVAFGPSAFFIAPIYAAGAAAYTAKVKADNDRRLNMVKAIRETVSKIIAQIEQGTR